MVVRSEPCQLSLLDTALDHEPAGRRPVRPGSIRPLAELPISGRQPELPFRAPDPRANETARAALEHQLRAAIGHGTVALAITDNRRTMVSIRRAGDARSVRLHHMFLGAPPEVVTALGRYFARGDRFASRLIDRYIAAHQSHIRPSRPDAPMRRQSCGAVHDLAAIQQSLSERYFDGTVSVAITWGRQSGTRRRRHSRRTIRMGLYLLDEQLIRIHPALDQAFVPQYFVEWVVYHEMLHHVIPMPMVNGKRVYHSPEFRAREREFADYARAKAWEDANLSALISSRGAPRRPLRVLPY